MKRTVRTAVISVIAVIAGFLALDFCFGRIVESAMSHAKGGDTKNTYYINNLAQDSILIMGSSRANHHYIPDSIEQRLGMSTYNCGMDGNGIILAYGFLNNIINNGGRPRLIIYDFFPLFDLYDNNDRTNAINHLKPTCDKPGVKEIIDDIAPDEYVKYNLSSYRYNSIFIQILSDAVKPRQQTIKGYKPLNGSMTNEFQQNDEVAVSEFDTVKVKYFHKFLETVDKYGINLVFVTSPSFHVIKNADNYASLLKSLSRNQQYRYFNFLNNSEFTGHSELFVDPSHMNHSGAEKFVSTLLDSIAACKSNR